MNLLNIGFIAIRILFIFEFSNGDRIKTKIYKDLENKYYCIRRLNATNQIGCQSKDTGNVGIVHIIKSEDDIDIITNTGQYYPYIAVISNKYFNFQTLSRLKSSSERISGVILIEIESEVNDLKSFSVDKSCPNQYFDLYVNDANYSHCLQHKWNVVDNRDNDIHDQNLMFNDWPFPIFHIKNQTHIQDIYECFDNHSTYWPLCAIELQSLMFAAKDAITCMRKFQSNPINRIKKEMGFADEFCKPLVAQNVFSNLLTTSRNESIDDNSVVILAARVDSMSMFSGRSSGADSALTALITLLSVVHTLCQTQVKHTLRQISPKMNVMFALFDDESFDYIGSSSAVYDMNATKFPIDPNPDPVLGAPMNVSILQSRHISHFIELNQLAFHSPNDSKLFIHKNIHPNHKIQRLEDIMKANAQTMAPNLVVEGVADGQPLPPSSLQSFLKHNRSLIGVVIANHRKEYTNKFYHSLYDDFQRLNNSGPNLTKHLSMISTLMANTIYDLMTNKSAVNASAPAGNGTRLVSDETVVQQLIECYFIDTNCSLFNTVYKKAKPSQPVKVYTEYTLTHNINSYTYRLLAYFNGEEVLNTTEAKCSSDESDSDKRYDYNWIPGPNRNGTCIRSQIIRQFARSPAFQDNGISNSELYSSWTESAVNEPSVRLFLMASPSQQWTAFLVGLVLLIVSFIIITIIQLFSAQLFANRNDFHQLTDQSTESVE